MDARLATTLVLGFMAALFGWQMFAVRQTALEQAGHQAMALARTAELQIIGNLGAADLLAADVTGLLLDHAIDDLALRSALRTRLAAHPGLRSLVLTAPDGREVLAVARTESQANASGDEIGTLPAVIITHRSLNASDGHRLGEAAVGVLAAPVIEGLGALPLGDDGRVWLIGAGSHILAAVTPHSDADLRLAESTAAGVSDHEFPLPPDRISVRRLRLSDGDRMVAIRPLDGLGLTVAVGLSVSTILAPWRENLWRYGSTMLALAGLALIYAWLLDRQSRRTAAARREKERLRAQAADRQHAILDATIDGLLTIDGEGRIVDLNRAADRIFGYAGSALLGQPVSVLIPSLVPSSETTADCDNRSWNNCRTETTGRHRDGRILPLDVAITALPTPDANLDTDFETDLFIGTVRDLSERRATEAALRASQERNTAILAAAADGIIAVDRSGRMETVNDAAGRIFGYPPTQMIGRSIAMLMPTPFHCGQDDEIVDCVRSGRLESLVGGKREITGRRHDGTGFPLELSVSTLEPSPPADSAENTLFIAVLADISQRKEAELALRSAKLDAEAANQAKTQFLAHMSHELRTPLNAIIGFSDMMKLQMMGTLSPVYLDYARNINDSGRQLIGIIDDLLDVSRLQLGKFTLSDGVVDLHSAVAGALAMMRSRAEDGGIVLSEGVAESLPKLRGDARAIRQVLINLVSNAVKFTPRGGTVRVSAEQNSDDGRLMLAVADTGHGIPPDLIDRVLDPFHHADAFRANKGRGVGLGLPICRWLMELHGGSLTILRTAPVGTTVVAGFPKERVLPGTMDIAVKIPRL